MLCKVLRRSYGLGGRRDNKKGAETREDGGQVTKSSNERALCTLKDLVTGVGACREVS